VYARSLIRFAVLTMGAPVVALSATSAQGVSTATILGTVRAANGASVDGASVLVRNTVTGFVTNARVANGGDAFVSWLPTGEVRVYNTHGGFFDQISPLRPVFNGGPGAWELVGRFSYIDLDSGPVKGGKFWRITPVVNWHMSDNVRLEFIYGYGSLNRFDLVGKTQFFQTRVQLQF